MEGGNTQRRVHFQLVKVSIVLKPQVIQYSIFSGSKHNIDEKNETNRQLQKKNTVSKYGVAHKNMKGKLQIRNTKIQKKDQLRTKKSYGRGYSQKRLHFWLIKTSRAQIIQINEFAIFSDLKRKIDIAGEKNKTNGQLQKVNTASEYDDAQENMKGKSYGSVQDQITRTIFAFV